MSANHVQLPLQEFNALLQIAAKRPYEEVCVVLDAVRAKALMVEVAPPPAEPEKDASDA
jgi:hypothetical protein